LDLWRNPAFRGLIVAVLLMHFCNPVLVAQFVADLLCGFACWCPAPFDIMSFFVDCLKIQQFCPVKLVVHVWFSG
jgi:hypothetical protein